MVLEIVKMLLINPAAGGEDPATLSAAWSDMTITWPGVVVTNEDRTVSWTVGGARTITAEYFGSNNLRYRINSGSWINYTAGFSLSSGQTLGWSFSAVSTNEFETITVKENTRTLDSFIIDASGYP